MTKLSTNPFDVLNRAHNRAAIQYRTEDGWPRCEAITNKKTRCTRFQVRKVEVIINPQDGVKNWIKETQWRCSQHA